MPGTELRASYRARWDRTNHARDHTDHARAGPRVSALVHKLDTELGVLIEVVALNGVACSRLWIELHSTEQQTGS
jgi:hypothetical protein